jgi:hypothetical protein
MQGELGFDACIKPQRGWLTSDFTPSDLRLKPDISSPSKKGGSKKSNYSNSRPTKGATL